MTHIDLTPNLPAEPRPAFGGTIRTTLETAVRPSSNPEHALDAAALRLAVVARDATRRPRFWAHLWTRLAEATYHDLTQHRSTSLAVMASPRMVRERGVIDAEERETHRLGHITNWVPRVVLWVLLASFILNEVPFMYSTARTQFDIPLSVKVWDVTHPGNALCIGLSMIVPALLYAAVAVGGKSIAWWIYPRRRGGLRPLVSTEEVHTHERNHIPRWCYVGGSVALILAISVILHSLATLRFSAGLFASSGAAADVYTALVTLLPTGLLLCTVVAENPRFAQGRDALRLIGRHESSERWMVATEGLLLRRYRRRSARASTWAYRLQDAIDAVVWRTDLEYLDASGAIASLPTQFGYRETEDPKPTGRAHSRFIDAFAAPSGLGVNVVARANRLPVDERLHMRDAWLQFKRDPEGFAREIPVGNRLTGATPGAHATVQLEKTTEV